MKRLLMLIVLLLAGCNSKQPEAPRDEQPEASMNEKPEAPLDEQPKALSYLEKMDLANQINSSGEMTEQLAESLSKVKTVLISGDLKALIDKYKNQ